MWGRARRNGELMKRGWYGESHRHYLAAKGYPSAQNVAEVLTLGMWKSSKDRIPGGLADNVPCEAFDKEALKKGMAVELEHTSDPQIAAEIARDHLTEDSQYYDKLALMEKSSLERMRRCQ